MKPTIEQEKPTVIFIMGPTASGKTDLAMSLFDRIPSEIISVDSTLVYRGMDIGTAKPSADELMRYPHQLVDICEPSEPYSVADFCVQAEEKINSAIALGKLPILVGGTMMYFKALLEGLAPMPSTNAEIRSHITAQANELGWPHLHKELERIDPEYAKQLHPNHSQRISRALEVYRASGITMTESRRRQAKQSPAELFSNRFNVIQFALVPSDRRQLHQRIESRFHLMLEKNFIDEVTQLRARGDLHLDLPSMRAVGYRQVWHYLDEDLSYKEMVEKAIVATRQLAKRQLTWLRGWSELNKIDVSWATKLKDNDKNLKIMLNYLPTKCL